MKMTMLIFVLGILLVSSAYAFKARSSQPPDEIEEELSGIELTGQFSESVYDIDKDGHFDFLDIKVRANVSVPGNYTWSGYIKVGLAELYSYHKDEELSEGVHDLLLRFPGKSIYALHDNGPYDLQQIDIRNRDSKAWLSASLDYNTSAYNYTDFDAPGANFTGNFYDYVTDEDKNCLYDYLFIEAELNVTEAGYYEAYAPLEVGDDFVSVGYSNYTVLEPGIRNLTLRVSGREIKRQGNDGPYELEFIRLRENGDVTWILDDPYNTSAYKYADFDSHNLSQLLIEEDIEDYEFEDSDYDEEGKFTIYVAEYEKDGLDFSVFVIDSYTPENMEEFFQMINASAELTLDNVTHNNTIYQVYTAFEDGEFGVIWKSGRYVIGVINEENQEWAYPLVHAYLEKYPSDVSWEAVSSTIIGHSPSESTITMTEDGSQSFSVSLSRNSTVQWSVNDTVVSTGHDYTYQASGAGIFEVTALVLESNATRSWTIIAVDRPIMNGFDGTDISSLSESQLASVSGFTLENSKGKIEFMENVDLRNIIDIGSCVVIDNVVAVSCLDEPARITLYNLKYNSKPVVYYTEAFTINAGEVDKVCDFCNITSYDAFPRDDGKVVFEAQHFTTFKVEGSNELKIDDVTVKVDGKKESSAREDGGSIDSKIYPGSEITVDVKLKNNLNVALEDVEIEGILEDIGDDDLEDYDEIRKISSGRKKSAKLEFTIPFEADEGDYDLIITIEGIDDNGTVYSTAVEYTVEVNRKKHELRIRSLEASDVGCSRNGQLQISLMNLGDDTEEDVSIDVKGGELGIDFTRRGIEVETYPGELFRTSLDFEVSNVSTGTYPLGVTINYDDGADQETAEVVVKGCAVEPVRETAVKEEIVVVANAASSAPKTAPWTGSSRRTYHQNKGDSYLTFLAAAFVILSGVFVLAITALAAQLKKRKIRRKQR